MNTLPLIVALRTAERRAGVALRAAWVLGLLAASALVSGAPGVIDVR